MKPPSTNSPDAPADILGQLPPGSRVAVIRLRSLGDCVLTTPALQLLKTARPDLNIAIVVEDRFAAIFENPLSPSIRALRDFRPDLCLNLHGGTRSARLTALSGAKFRAGFDIFKPSLIYNVPVPTAQQVLGITRRVHTAEHMAAAVFHLGVPVTEVPRAHIKAAPAQHQKPYAVIHPVAATPEKTWPAAAFAQLAPRLPFQPVFIAGPSDDLTPFKQWQTIIGAPLPELASLMQGASLFIGNDSGPAHMAAAFGIPQVVIFGPSDAEIWAPWRTEARVIKAAGPISSVTVDQVMHAVEQLL